jgi:para-nitrobenzyl esterase
MQADGFSSECTQYSEFGEIIGDEDCLYLNVWRPQTEETDLPVYFWIHGGGNSIGTASSLMYDGSNVTSKGNLVVVTINYRLGPLGWFTHPELRNGTPLDNSGNYGTMDMVKALDWVKNNISSFGGDPDKVTIAGESAGGSDVNSLVMSPHAAGLFHRGIIGV